MTERERTMENLFFFFFECLFEEFSFILSLIIIIWNFFFCWLKWMTFEWSTNIDYRFLQFYNEKKKVESESRIIKWMWWSSSSMIMMAIIFFWICCWLLSNIEESNQDYYLKWTTTTGCHLQTHTHTCIHNIKKKIFVILLLFFEKSKIVENSNHHDDDNGNQPSLLYSLFNTYINQSLLLCVMLSSHKVVVTKLLSNTIHIT